jgi:hypothetical protein
VQSSVLLLVLTAYPVDPASSPLRSAHEARLEIYAAGFRLKHFHYRICSVAVPKIAFSVVRFGFPVQGIGNSSGIGLMRTLFGS